MPKPFLPTTALLLFTLAAMMACTGTTPAPEPTETPTPSRTAAATPLPANTPVPEGETLQPPPTPKAITTAAVTPAQASSPTPEPTPDGSLAPIVLQDSHSLQSALSEAELGCIGDNPEELAFALRGPGPESPEEQARLLNCLHDETLARLFVAGFVAGPEPLSLETSECVREAFDVIDPRSVMMAGIEGDPGRAMAGSMVAFTVATACLTDKEWDSAAPMSGPDHSGKAGGAVPHGDPGRTGAVGGSDDPGTGGGCRHTDRSRRNVWAEHGNTARAGASHSAADTDHGDGDSCPEADDNADNAIANVDEGPGDSCP